MSCQLWYYKYKTKKQCEDELDGSFSTSISSEEIRENPTSEITDPVTVYSPTMEPKSSTFPLEEDIVTDFDIDDEFEDTISPVRSSPAETIDEQEQVAEHILNVQIETPNMKVQFKRKKRIDGEVLTIVIFLEVGALAMVSFLLYYGMKFFGRWWRRGHNYNLDNAERSHLPLHEHQGDNPEETIRPRIEEVEEDESDLEEPAGYSTAIENTQMTNTTMLGFSPIGPPPNRTVSMTGLETDGPATRTQQRSSSGPIPMNIDEDIEDEENEGEILNGTQLLQQPPLQAADEIIEDNESDDESDNESTVSTNERRYPERIRNAPERYGFSVKQ